MTSIDDLISRLEQATGPSRELADEVLLACGWTFVPGHTTSMYGDMWYAPNGLACDPSLRPNPLESIDAALTLVPDKNHTTYITIPTKRLPYPSQSHAFACVAPPGLGGPAFSRKRAHVSCHHPVAAIAITISALRARRAKEEG